MVSCGRDSFVSFHCVRDIVIILFRSYIPGIQEKRFRWCIGYDKAVEGCHKSENVGLAGSSIL